MFGLFSVWPTYAMYALISPAAGARAFGPGTAGLPAFLTSAGVITLGNGQVALFQHYLVRLKGSLQRQQQPQPASTVPGAVGDPIVQEASVQHFPERLQGSLQQQRPQSAGTAPSAVGDHVGHEPRPQRAGRGIRSTWSWSTERVPVSSFRPARQRWPCTILDKLQGSLQQQSNPLALFRAL